MQPKFERMKKMIKLKLAAGLVAAAFTGVLLAVSAGAAQLTDIDGHWSEQYVEYGVEHGYINGYPDGSFKPDASVTRAEFATMLNSAVGITQKAEISFFDVEENDWFYPEIQKAVYAGYVAGYEDGSFLAQNNITRQEAAVILSRIATRAQVQKSLDGFNDADEVADWAKEAFKFAYSKSYISGDDLGNLLPNSSLTRSQAAKIIYMLVESENIYNGDYTISLDDAVCSETIFTDNVIFSSDAKDAKLSLDGCRVLGTLNIKTVPGASVTIEDSTVSLLEVNGAEPVIDLTQGAQVKYTVLEYPATLSGTGYGSVYLNGDDLISGTVYINDPVEKVVVSASAIIRANEISQFNITDKTTVTLQTGNVENMSVLSGSAGSVITLASNVAVENLSVSSACSFMGAGKITNAHNNVSGVTYETKPEKLTGTGTDDDDDDETAADGYFTTSSVYPDKKAVSVSLSSNIVLSFDRAVYDEDGNNITASYIEDCFEIRRSRATGTKVSFSANVTATKTRITLKPDDDLSYDTRYYVVADAGVLTDKDGNKLAALSYYFNTRESSSSSSSGTITFSPDNGDDDVDTDDTLKITFSKAIRDSDGDSVTTNYLSTKAISLRKTSTSGTSVPITATINSTAKIITVEPEQPLEPDTKYYLIVNSGTLEYSGGVSVSRSYIYFYTSDDLDVTVTPANARTNIAPDTEIVLEFNAEIYRPSGSNVTTSYLSEQAIELRKSSSSGTKVDFTAVISSDRRTVTIIPSQLEEGTRYYVVIPAGMIANENGTENDRLYSYFTTANAMTPVFKPASGSTGVLPSSEIEIRFNEELFDKEKNHITAEYVKENVVSLKKNSSSGTAIDFDVKISSDYRIITITPKTPFAANSTYYVSVARSTMYNADGKANLSGSSSFKTTYSNKPDFIPYDGEEDVDTETSIDITFDSKMYAIGGADLTTTYIKNNVIRLYKGSLDGAAVSFTASVSSDRQTITINPSSDLAGDTVYVVVVRASSLEDASGNENALYTSSFTTAESISTGVTITPDNRATGVSVNTSVAVEFESSVYRPGGIIASSAYIVNNAIEIRKGSSSSGTKIECTAVVSDDNKTIILTPTEPLETKTTYYVRIISGMLEYSDGTTKVSSKTSYFTTNDGTPVIDSVKVTETGASSVTVAVKAGTDGTVYVTAADSNGTEVSAPAAEILTNETKNITVTGLASNTSYTISVYIMDASGVSSAKKTATAKTLVPFEFEITDTVHDSFTVVVNAMCDGAVDITYKNRKTGQTYTRVTGLTLKEGTEREFSISDLDSSTEYDVTIKFTDSFGGVFTQTGKATTTAPQQEQLEITSLTLTDSNGDIYTSTVKDGKASFTIEKSSFVKLAGKSSVKNSEFSFNSGSAVNPGESSQSILVTPGETTTVSVVLTSNDTQKTVSCTVSITVNS